jgi:hypothetical protein
MYVQRHNTLLVGRAERKQGMEHGGFSGASLEDEGVPEARREGGRDLGRSATLEPVKVEPLVCV